MAAKIASHGKFRPISFPAVPWCIVCKLFVCDCAPLPAGGEPLQDGPHPHCGSSRCCGTC